MPSFDSITMACLLLIQGKWSIILWTHGYTLPFNQWENLGIPGLARSEHVMAPDPTRGFSNSLSLFTLLWTYDSQWLVCPGAMAAYSALNAESRWVEYLHQVRLNSPCHIDNAIVRSKTSWLCEMRQVWTSLPWIESTALKTRHGDRTQEESTAILLQANQQDRIHRRMWQQEQ